MKIEHIAVWTKDIEGLKSFYESVFGAIADEKYVNSKKRFGSYFLNFGDGSRLEIMTIPDILETDSSALPNVHAGYAHIAISVGSQDEVDSLTASIKAQGFHVISEPRYTGDGYYESVILDPDGNPIEITI
jgi:lactoylglutathione lyase